MQKTKLCIFTVTMRYKPSHTKPCIMYVCIIRERFDFRDVIGHKLGGTPSLLDTKSHWVILQSNF
jgi:hypothetical protein